MSMTPFEAVVRRAQIEAMKNRATAAERATLFKSGHNYLYVGESGFLVHVCHRKYDGNGHFAGYAGMNYQWQWSEVGRLAFVYQTQGAVGGHGDGGYPVLFAWPAPGHVPLRDDNESRPGPDPSVAVRWDGWPIRAKTWLTGIRRSRHGEWLLLELRLWSGQNWRYPRAPTTVARGTSHGWFAVRHFSAGAAGGRSPGQCASTIPHTSSSICRPLTGMHWPAGAAVGGTADTSSNYDRLAARPLAP